MCSAMYGEALRQPLTADPTFADIEWKLWKIEKGLSDEL